jgi:hypothetical protein
MRSWCVLVIFSFLLEFFSAGAAEGEAIPVSAARCKSEVHLVAVKTDIARRYRWIVPPLPIPPFTTWRKWLAAHEDAVHCVLEWRDENGSWSHSELRSRKHPELEPYCVGSGELPGTGYPAYGIYIVPGKMPRDRDELGEPIVITMDEVIDCDCQKITDELRNYGRTGAKRGSPETGGGGRHNVGLGGPAFKPSQNSNTMVKYVLQQCGVIRPSPDKAVGWDTEPHFPYSTDADMPALDCGW